MIQNVFSLTFPCSYLLTLAAYPNIPTQSTFPKGNIIEKGGVKVFLTKRVSSHEGVILQWVSFFPSYKYIARNVYGSLGLELGLREDSLRESSPNIYEVI